MVKLKSTLVPLTIALALPWGTGCKKGSTAEDAPVAVSPVGNAPAGEGQPAATPAPRGKSAARRPPDPDDWRKAADAPRTKGGIGQPAATAPTARIAGDADGRKDEGKKDEATRDEEGRRKALEAKVDAVLGSAMGALKGCFEAGGETTGKIALRFRVHRSGYVMTPTVAGVSASSATCAQAVLSRLKVSGNDVGTVDISRTLNFERRTMPR